CFPPLLWTHTPTGCGQGGTRNNNTSRTITSEYPASVNGTLNRYGRGDRPHAPPVWSHLPPHWDDDQATPWPRLSREALPGGRTGSSSGCYEPGWKPHSAFPVPALR